MKNKRAIAINLYFLFGSKAFSTIQQPQIKIISFISPILINAVDKSCRSLKEIDKYYTLYKNIFVYLKQIV